MKRPNRFHFFVDVNRKFLASGTIIATDLGTDVSVNVDTSVHAQEAACTVLLLAAHNICNDDSDRLAIASILAEMGCGTPGPIKSAQTTPEDLAQDLDADIPF